MLLALSTAAFIAVSLILHACWTVYRPRLPVPKLSVRRRQREDGNAASSAVASVALVAARL